MSDNVLKIISTDRNYVPSLEAQEKAVAWLEKLLPEGEMCKAEVYDRIEFIDQGGNLEMIRCPSCGARLLLDGSPQGEAVGEWWQDTMDRADAAGGYEGFKTSMPCCKKEVYLTDLEFEWPAGFARFELSIWNPNIGAVLSREKIEQLELVLNCVLRQIWAHY